VWVSELRELAKAEPEMVAGIIQNVAPVQFTMTLPAANTLNALVTAQPYQGKPLAEWTRHMRQAELDRIMQAVRIGMVQGESSDQIARRVVGTKLLRGRDGVLQLSRHGAEALTRTLVNGVANQAKAQLYEENEDIIREEAFVATLDARTTPVCRANDGKRFPVGKGPRPPLHWACRSLRVAVIADDLIGQRPYKAATEQMLLREYAQRTGLQQVPRRRADLPRGTKSEFDAYARKRGRELTGRAPAPLTYDKWLRRQSVEFQNDVLGPARARMFRDGLSLDKFVNRAGDELTLSELRAKYGSSKV
jgi:SPP1 gp7 family putative phage head morphogenesis protein